MIRAGVLSLALIAGLSLMQGCNETPTTALEELEGVNDPITFAGSEKKLDHLAACAPTAANFPNPLVSTNPYFPITVGYQWTLEGEEEGLAVKALLTVLPLTRSIDGIRAAILEEREWAQEEEGGPLLLNEISWNYFSENEDGDVCYRGESVDDIVEDPVGTYTVVGNEGAWCAEDDPDVNHAGIFMPREENLRPGTSFLQEDAPLIAVDGAKIVSSGIINDEIFGGPYTDTVRLQEFSLVSGKKEKGDVKDFGEGVGILIDGPLVLTDFTTAAAAPPAPAISMQTCGTP
ncbi:MAG TPA: hypothetical protein VFQ21_09515 [Gemmatimonadota bacterium]|nr:hypothetical protein [Gemmatimonadota bacterium]